MPPESVIDPIPDPPAHELTPETDHQQTLQADPPPSTDDEED